MGGICKGEKSSGIGYVNGYVSDMIPVASVGCDVELDGDILAYVGFWPVRCDSSRNNGDLNSLSKKGQ